MEILKPNWPAPENISAFITTRKGGLSLSPWNSNNFGFNVGDNIKSVENNWRLLSQEVSLPSRPQLLDQVHGVNVVQATCDGSTIVGDGSFTKKSKIVCSVTTADCLPILICDVQGTLVASIHAGWRGLSAGIITNLIKQLNVNPDDLIVYIGPTISQKNFEVGHEVKKAFLNRCCSIALQEKVSSCFVRVKQKNFYQDEKWRANLYELAKIYFNENYVFKIYGGDLCTYDDYERFYSYRRDGNTGRMASLIWFS